MKTDTKTKRKRLCKACDGEFFPSRGVPSLHRFIGRDGRCYIANAGAERKRICRACGSEFFWVNSNQVYWSEVCRHVPAPAVYNIASSLLMVAVTSVLAPIGSRESVTASHQQIRDLSKHWPNIQPIPGLSRYCRYCQVAA